MLGSNPPRKDRAVARVLVLHASIDGQTARIAERIASILRARGLEATVRAADAPGAASDIESHDGIVIGAGIRYGHHPAWLKKLVRRRLAQIAGRPSAFFSVCLSAGGPGARPATARAYLDDFEQRTGWSSDQSASFAGALLYRRYRPHIRFLIRCIMKVTGGETDASRDYEYTDWAAVERFAGEFARRVPAPVAGASTAADTQAQRAYQ